MFEVLLWLAIGIAVGWFIIELWVRMTVKRLEEEMYHTLQKGIVLVDKHIIMMDVTKDNDMYYCYDDRDGSFVCQGETYQQIVDAFKSRYPGRIFFVNDRFKHYFPEDFKQSKFARVD